MSITTAQEAKKAIQNAKDSTPEKAALFFKTQTGTYGAHEKFVGITVPTIRKIAKQAKSLSFYQLKILLQSVYNEERLLALIILICQRRSDPEKLPAIVDFYLENKECVNNWNLVDASAHTILGEYLIKKDKSILFEMIDSENLWIRRIAIVATWAFIKEGNVKPTFMLAKKCFNDPEDLMHKAVGWMLREAGKKDENALIDFLDQYWSKMPRTMLRYAIERLPETQRQAVLRRR